MSIQNLIILSQIQPPAQRNNILVRPRIMNRLKSATDCPVTILEAGTGHGKSTSVISFVNALSQPIFWYTISGADRDPALFLAELFTAFNQGHGKRGEKAHKSLTTAEEASYKVQDPFVLCVSR